MKLLKWITIGVVAYVVWETWKVKEAAPGFSWKASFDHWRAGF